MLKRKQIYIKAEQEKRLEIEAVKKKSDVSKIIRAAIDQYLARPEKDIDWDNDSFSKAIGVFEGKDSDLSLNHDHYLYGAKKKGR